MQRKLWIKIGIQKNLLSGTNNSDDIKSIISQAAESVNSSNLSSAFMNNQFILAKQIQKYQQEQKIKNMNNDNRLSQINQVVSPAISAINNANNDMTNSLSTFQIWCKQIQFNQNENLSQQQHKEIQTPKLKDNNVLMQSDYFRIHQEKKFNQNDTRKLHKNQLSKANIQQSQYIQDQQFEEKITIRINQTNINYNANLMNCGEIQKQYKLIKQAKPETKTSEPIQNKIKPKLNKLFQQTLLLKTNYNFFKQNLTQELKFFQIQISTLIRDQLSKQFEYYTSELDYVHEENKQFMNRICQIQNLLNRKIQQITYKDVRIQQLTQKIIKQNKQLEKQKNQINLIEQKLQDLSQECQIKIQTLNFQIIKLQKELQKNKLHQNQSLGQVDELKVKLQKSQNELRVHKQKMSNLVMQFADKITKMRSYQDEENEKMMRQQKIQIEKVKLQYEKKMNMKLEEFQIQKLRIKNFVEENLQQEYLNLIEGLLENQSRSNVESLLIQNQANTSSRVMILLEKKIEQNQKQMNDSLTTGIKSPNDKNINSEDIETTGEFNRYTFASKRPSQHQLFIAKSLSSDEDVLDLKLNSLVENNVVEKQNEKRHEGKYQKINNDDKEYEQLQNEILLRWRLKKKQSNQSYPQSSTKIQYKSFTDRVNSQPNENLTKIDNYNQTKNDFLRPYPKRKSPNYSFNGLNQSPSYNDCDSPTFQHKQISKKINQNNLRKIDINFTFFKQEQKQRSYIKKFEAEYSEDEKEDTVQKIKQRLKLKFKSKYGGQYNHCAESTYQNQLRQTNNFDVKKQFNKTQNYYQKKQKEEKKQFTLKYRRPSQQNMLFQHKKVPHFAINSSRQQFDSSLSSKHLSPHNKSYTSRSKIQNGNNNILEYAKAMKYQNFYGSSNHYNDKNKNSLNNNNSQQKISSKSPINKIQTVTNLHKNSAYHFYNKY